MKQGEGRGDVHAMRKSLFLLSLVQV